MKKAILLLHGFATDPTDFDPIIDNLKTIYDHIETPFMPGHKVKGLKGFTCNSTIALVENIISELEQNYDVIDIMGFSMGGALGSYLASKHHVRNLILLAPANVYINPKFPLERVKAFAEYLDAKLFESNGHKKNKIIKEHELRLKEDSDAMKVTKKFLLPNYNPRSIAQFAKIIRYCKDNMKKISSPTLIILGDIDQLVPERTYDYLAKYCLNLKKVKFKGVSHMMLRSTKSDQLIKTIMSFITENDK